MISGIDSLQSSAYQQKLNQCIHCGLCLQACPTYQLFGTEMDAPRGRIALMNAAAQGRIGLAEIQSVFSEHINLCLACRSCETACPSGVRYGELVEAARVVVERNRKPRIVEQIMRWVGTRQLMPFPGRLRFTAQVLRLYQKSGMQNLVRRLDVLPDSIQALEDLLPPYIARSNDYSQPALAVGEQRGVVLFFQGCIQESFLAGVNQATLSVLQRNGYRVITPEQQTCCGAAQLHLGDLEYARQLARQNVDAFLRAGDDINAIISNAGGCGLSLKEYPQLLADDPHYRQKAQLFAAKVYDINEFLADHLYLLPRGSISRKAVYADSCHLRHGQKVSGAPRQILRKIPGLELVELQHPDQCCGSAGVYNIMHPEPAGRILDAKMADIMATQADLVITSNTGCHLQLIAGVRRSRMRAQVCHVVEVLELSYKAAD